MTFKAYHAYLIAFLLCFSSFMPLQAQTLAPHIQKINHEAKPWVFWYWMHASFSKEGITADLKAMKEAGIAGAYIAPIKGKTNPPLYEPVIETLTPVWWDIFKFALEEAKRFDIKIALLPNDGFATAGGPWITPQLSMQKVVYSTTTVKGGSLFNTTLKQPEAYQNYYQDIAVLAFPTPGGKTQTTQEIKPLVTTSNGQDASFLAETGHKKNFGSNEPCWIQYAFDKPFLCRSIKISVNNFNHQSNRLWVEVSDDGKNFRSLGRLQAPRTGWLDWDAPVTHEIEPVSAKYFRFVYNPEGTEPGAEDLDAAKWKQSLKINGIELSSLPKIHQFEGKSGLVWRVGEHTKTIPDDLAIPIATVLNISDKLDAKGNLKWTAPKTHAEWTIIRIGHTSTGHKNETAGAGKGLEVDKFNPEAVKLQFDKWYGEALRVAGADLAKQVLGVFHVDSWECGSQNWSPVFMAEFQKRRGYDPTLFLPTLAGFPIASPAKAEQFLYDMRKTIAELMHDNFFVTLKNLAQQHGAIFTAETTAPVMLGDGLKHFGTVDVPMGEFWAKSPSHDKPNDMLDAISGAHIYGKNIIQAEAFTTVRMEWDEHPGNLKTLQDRNYALGVNKLVYHVYVHNPWLDRKPGMTLDGVGLYFQRDQTWWEQGKEWVAYAERCQSLLQQGKPVADLAVFVGEEYPSRAILPDRLVNTLPGIFGDERVAAEAQRMANKALPTQKVAGVTTSANMAQPERWINPLRGYTYDSFNADVLQSASFKNGKVVFASGAEYRILVLPLKHQLNPNQYYTETSLAKILELVNAGALCIIGDKPQFKTGLKADEKLFNHVVEAIWGGTFENIKVAGSYYEFKNSGKGKFIKAPFLPQDFSFLGAHQDVLVKDTNGKEAPVIAWNHRKTATKDIYFIANQLDTERNLSFAFSVSDKQARLYDAVSDTNIPLKQYQVKDGYTHISIKLPANGSLFVIFEGSSSLKEINKGFNYIQYQNLKNISTAWKVKFNQSHGGPAESIMLDSLQDWSTHSNPQIKYYSGTATYNNSFTHKASKNEEIWLDLGEVANIASVKVNGIDCGIVWTPPYRVNISKALKKGQNQLEIKVSNTWANRLIGDQLLPEDKRITKTTAPFRLEGKALNKAGLLGTVSLLKVIE